MVAAVDDVAAAAAPPAAVAATAAAVTAGAVVAFAAVAVAAAANATVAAAAAVDAAAVAAVCAAAAVAAACAAAAPPVTAASNDVAADLEQIRQSRIFFIFAITCQNRDYLQLFTLSSKLHQIKTEPDVVLCQQCHRGNHMLCSSRLVRIGSELWLGQYATARTII